MTDAQRLLEQAQHALGNRRPDDAKALLDRALRAEPGNPMVLTKLAEFALRDRDQALAERHLLAALAAEPHFAPAWTELAHARWLAGRRGAATEAARRALDIQPFVMRFRLRYVQFAAWTGHIREAREALAPLLDPAGSEPPAQAMATAMLGEILIAAGQFEAAIQPLEDALRRLPSLPAATIMLAMNRLRLGDFRAGWPGLDIREPGRELYKDGPPAAFGAWWTGGPIAGRSILIADDQGHGDAIQVFRYLPMIRAMRPARITWRTFPPLVRLFAAAAPDVTVLAGLPEDAAFDTHCTSTNLPRWLDTTADTIPGGIPYLRAPARSRLSHPRNRRLKVGLVWSGDQRHMRDHLRSIPAALFLTLADIPDIAFYSLQHEVRDQDRPALDARPAIDRRVEQAIDLADTATLIAGLDLVIAVDTGVVHLAGAMGKPVWLLLHSTPDWRWQAERTDSPWYPSLRLFRLKPGEWIDRPRRDPEDMGWRPLVRRVAKALRTLSARRDGRGMTA
ncbi:tetratricopeptide repeat protein [Rhodopila sp.]|jgi:Tfp pilus assembly protein PilF|uniref:tetratricopeptide repeat protein n=1 Tax=Rhodopila sp. TaxID=2480087 RepID=UPI002C1AC3AF|nr:tetratricopeptide repeat protein [Rhodopila sp.]HVZ07675.1 tetratricopeptide repeat protein [Rhodopila sp.]